MRVLLGVPEPAKEAMQAPEGNSFKAQWLDQMRAFPSRSFEGGIRSRLNLQFPKPLRHSMKMP
jgi:hypothetical protein